jgi:hypothetical protein
MNNLFTKDDIVSISAYASEYKLLPWIDGNKIVMKEMYSNPNAIHLIEECIEVNLDICWENLCGNPNAIHLIEKRDKNSEEVESLASNPNAVHILEKIIHIEEKYKIYIRCYIRLFRNPNAIHIIKKHIETNIKNMKWGHWYNLCLNPNAIHIIEEIIKNHPANIPSNTPIYDFICNPNAVHIIKEYEGKDIVNGNYTYRISENWNYYNPNGKICLSGPHLVNEIDWTSTCRNPSAINFIKQHTDRIVWDSLSSNPSIFELEHINENIYNILNTLE